MPIQYLGDLEAKVLTQQERLSTIRVSSLQRIRGNCHIALSSMTMFHPLISGTIVIGYRTLGGEIISTLCDPERVIVNAEIVSAILSPNQNVAQYVSIAHDVSSITLNNLISVTFALHVKTSTTERIHAKAAFFVEE